MMNRVYVKRFSFVLGAVFALSACVSSNTVNKTRPATGEKAGQIAVYTSDALDETVAVSVNEHFLAAMQANQQFEQGICEGNYELVARSVVSTPTTDNRAIRIVGRLPIRVNQAEEQTYLLTKNGYGWEFQPVTKAEISGYGKYSEASKNLVRRLPDALVRCE